jgi:protein disulfide-isomerase
MRKPFLRLFAICALLAVSASAAIAADGWSESYAKSLSRAKKDHKLMLIDFTGSDWCTWCIKLEQEVFSNPQFKDYAATNLVLMRADFPQTNVQSDALKAQNQKLQEKYHVEGYPTIVVLNAAGKQVGQLGYQPGGPAPFIAELEKLKK